MTSRKLKLITFSMILCLILFAQQTGLAHTLSSFNSALNTSQMRAAIENYTTDNIGVGSSGYTTLNPTEKDGVADALISARPSGGYATLADVEVIFEVAVEVNKVETSTEFQAILDNVTYASRLGLTVAPYEDHYANYGQLTAEGKLIIADYLLQRRNAIGGAYGSLAEVASAFENAMLTIGRTGIAFTPDKSEKGVVSGDSTQQSPTITVRFPAQLIEKNGTPNIIVNESTTGVNIYAGSKVVNGNTLEIYVKSALKPNAIYTVSVPSGSIMFPSFSKYNLNTSITWSFYTENKATPLLYTFEPGSDQIIPNTSAFGYGLTDYFFPELFGVNRIGVGINQSLVITFAEPIEIPQGVDLSDRITVMGEPSHFPMIEASIVPSNRKQMMIKFVTDDIYKFLEPGTIYTIRIPPNVIIDADSMQNRGSYSYNNEVTLIFKTANGFKRTFLDSSALEINEIFADFAPRNIAVDVPQIYIEKVETIHRYQGLAPGQQQAPNLTNIDITTHPDVQQIKVETNQGIRPALEKMDGRFTTGFAGLNTDVSEITLYAYDKYEKLLEKRSFKLGVSNGNGGAESFIKGDYVAPITSTFGNVHSMYDFMQDPRYLEDILKHIPVSQLDDLGVFYPYFTPYNNVNP